MDEFTIAPKALYEEVAERLRQKIFSGELESGDWIDEVRWTQLFGISRTPLREALKVLASEGLVTMRVRRGAYVTEVSERDLREVYHLLGLLESDAAEAVAKQASAEELADLQGLHAQLCGIGRGPNPSREEFFACNQRFHKRLLEIAGNRWRENLVNDLRKVMRLSRQQSLLRTGRINEALAEHEAIMTALVARDPTLSKQRMLEHFRNGLAAASTAKHSAR